MSSMVQLEYYGTDEPFWVDNAWLDTVVVVGLTCFILCLMKLSKVSTSKMGMIYGVVGMAALIIGYWVSISVTVCPNDVYEIQLYVEVLSLTYIFYHNFKNNLY